jgi:hypothetical protein
MGRRELLIALAFVAVGILAYQLTATGDDSSSPAPFSRLVTEFRREVRGNPGRASFTHAGTVAAPADITELRLPPVGTVAVRGEPRGDVAYELTIQAAGPDDRAALEAAREATVSSDTFGHVLALQHARQARSTAALTVRVPSRLTVRLEGIRRATVSDVAAVHLDGLVGDAQLSNVAGQVSGAHRNGTLAISGAASVDVTLTGSRASVESIRGSIGLNGRGGAVQIIEPAGAVDVHASDLDLILTRPRGRVRIAGTAGQVVIDRPDAATDIDGRRLEVTIILARPAPVTAVTTERTLRLLFDGAPPVTIDARSEGGTIDARAFDLTPERTADGERLRHRFGDAAVLALRNAGGAIVVGRTK